MRSAPIGQKHVEIRTTRPPLLSSREMIFDGIVWMVRCRKEKYARVLIYWIKMLKVYAWECCKVSCTRILKSQKNFKPVGALIPSMRIPLISLLKFVSSGYFSFSRNSFYVIFLKSVIWRSLVQIFAVALGRTIEIFVESNVQGDNKLCKVLKEVLKRKISHAISKWCVSDAI